MPDISMCKNEACTVKQECFRFMARPNPHRQSYSIFTQDTQGECVDFIAVKVMAGYVVREAD